MPEDHEKRVYRRVKDLFAAGWTTKIGEEVRKEIVTELDKRKLDESVIREQADWSALKDKLVGAEGT